MVSADAAAPANAPLVLCAGIAVLDQVYHVDRFPVAQAKTRAGAFATVIGGCAANAALAIARLGGRTRLAAPLGGPAGEDPIGDRILAGLVREGVDCADTVRVAGATSPISAILIDAAGDRAIVNHRDDGLAVAKVDDPARLVADVAAVVIDNRFPEFVLPIASAARRRGVPVVLDGDAPTRETDALLAASSHVVFSAEGLSATAGSGDLAAALDRIARRTRAFLAVTDGANDVLFIDAGRVRRMPVFAVDAIDTLGAGDVFHGALALALAQGRDEVDAMRFSAAAAGIKCTRFGGGSGAPTRAEVDAFLAARRRASAS